MRVLRAAGYARHALQVAMRVGGQMGAAWVLELYLEDLDAPRGALAFVEQLPRPARAEALKK